MQPQAAKLDDLLDNAAWVHALARQLLDDSGAADDVAQETWIAACQARASGAGLRPWLARVARNFALQRRRADASRALREQVAARPERQPATSEVVERAELHARLVAAVLALEEPHRSTLLWRYFEDLAAEEIARRAGIELATVRSRLKRARERLREDLIAQCDTPPEQWLTALLPIGVATSPLVPRVATTSAPLGVIGGLAMSTKLAAIGAATALVALVGWWAWSQRAIEFAHAPTKERGPEAIARADGANSAFATDSATDSRVEVAVADVNAKAAASSHAMLHGIVLGEDGRRPLSGARVSHRRGSELDFTLRASAKNEKVANETRSDDSGHFEIAAPIEGSVGLWFEFDGYLPLKLAAEDLANEADREIEAVLAPLGAIDVHVVDANGAAAPDVEVQYMIDLDRGASDQRSWWRTMKSAGKLDNNGRLTIERVPCGMPISVYGGDPFRYGARSPSNVIIDVNERRASLEIRLAAKAQLHGRVVDAQSQPLQSIKVSLEPARGALDDLERKVGRTDTAGRFRLKELDAGIGKFNVGVAGIESIEVDLAPGEDRDLGDLRVPELVPLSGWIVSELDGLDRSLTIHAFRGAQQLCELRPDADGAFATEVTPGELTLFISRGGWWGSDYMRPGEILTTLDLTEPATDLTIRVDLGRGAIRASLENIEVPERKRVTLNVWRRETAGDATGFSICSRTEAAPSAEHRVTIAPLEPGQYLLHAELAGVGSALSDEVTVVAGTVTDVGKLDFRLGAIAGRVVDAAGHAVAKATLSLRSANTHLPSAAPNVFSDDDGRFRFADLAADIYDVIVKQADVGLGLAESIAVRAQQTSEVTVSTRATATVQGIVHDAQGPIAGVELFVQIGTSSEVRSTHTDADGRFRFVGLPAGRTRPRVGRQVAFVVDLAPGETRELDIEIGSRASVRFMDNGVALAEVAHVYAGWGERWNIGTLSDGRVEIGGSSDPTLVMLNTRRLKVNENYVVFVPHVFGSMDIELSSRELVLDGASAWHGPLPTAMLVSFGHGEVTGAWGQAIGLAIERASDGRVRVPHLPEGAVVKLEGLDSKGRHVERTIDTGTELVTHLSWP